MSPKSDAAFSSNPLQTVINRHNPLDTARNRYKVRVVNPFVLVIDLVDATIRYTPLLSFLILCFLPAEMPLDEPGTVRAEDPKGNLLDFGFDCTMDCSLDPSHERYGSQELVLLRYRRVK